MEFAGANRPRACDPRGHLGSQADIRVRLRPAARDRIMNTALPPRDHAAFPVPGALRTALDTLLSGTSASAPQPIWPETITRIAESLTTEGRIVAPFRAAWSALYTVTLYLDHLQDADALGDPRLDALPPAIQYHLAFSAYIAAQHALSSLDPQAIPALRIVRLQRFWASSVAQIASGQYRDLTQALLVIQAQGRAPLDAYEQLAAQKTGATFALAFGGAAILATDDEAVIAAVTNAGMVYGMLLQYRDDLSDAEAQEGQHAATTLSRALLAAHPTLTTHGPDAVTAFWAAITAAYAEALPAILAPLPAETRTVYANLLQQSFGIALGEATP